MEYWKTGNKSLTFNYYLPMLSGSHYQNSLFTSLIKSLYQDDVRFCKRCPQKTGKATCVTLWINNVLKCMSIILTGVFLYLRQQINMIGFKSSTFKHLYNYMKECVCAWCPMMDWHYIQSAFLPSVFCNRLNIHNDPDQDQLLELVKKLVNKNE